MCGRFALFAEPKVFAATFDVPEPTLFDPRWNIAPTQAVLACRLDPCRGVRELARLRWGLIPSWATDPNVGLKAINARAETLAEKPYFRSAFRKQRCLIPVNGFYEWVRRDAVVVIV
jgi:putative SOS response-associated peptidase YedK